MKKALSKSIRTFYGVSDLGFGLMTAVELFYFVFFLTNVAKFSLPMVALIGSVTSIVDACLSPFYGAIISGTKPLKWGRNRSWLLIAPPFVVILYMFQYTKIGPEAVAAVIVCAGFILSHIIWNIQWVANVSLIPLLANNPEERGLLASRRGVWTSLSGVFFSYIAMPIALFFGSVTGNEVMGFTLLAGVMACTMMIGSFSVFKMTKGYEPTGAEEAQAGVQKAQKVSIGVMLKSALQNPPLLVLLVGDFFRFMSFFIMTAAGAFYFTYVAQNMALFPLYLLLGAIAGVVGAYSSGTLTNKFSTRTTSILGLFGLAISLIIGKFVAMNLVLFFILIVFSRVFFGMISAAMVGMYSDTAVYAEWKTGENTSAFVMGLMNLSLKTAIISRGTIIPIVLAAAGFVAGADPATASLVLKNAVNTVFLLIPGIFSLVGALIITFGYRLTKDKLVKYEAEIAERKSQKEAA